MNKKKSIILGIMSVAVIIGITIISVNLFEKNKFNNSEERIQELYNYGNYIETKDVKPNTIVARFNGEEILFREIKKYPDEVTYNLNIEQNLEKIKKEWSEVYGEKNLITD